MKLPKTVNAILCEDIRMEFTGKFSLAGVFGSDVAMTDLAAPLLCGVFAEIEPFEIGSAQGEVRILDGANDERLRMPLQINIGMLQRQPLSLGPFNFTVSAPGDVKIQWRIDEGRWTTVKTFKIMPHSQVPRPSAFAVLDDLIKKYAPPTVKEPKATGIDSGRQRKRLER